MSNAILSAQTLVILAAVAAGVHYLFGVDWPWAIVIGAAVSTALRAVARRWPEERPR